MQAVRGSFVQLEVLAVTGDWIPSWGWRCVVFGVLPTALADETVFTSSPRRISSLVVAESVFKRFLMMHPWECVALQYQKRELSFPIGNVPTRFVNIHAILLYVVGRLHLSRLGFSALR